MTEAEEWAWAAGLFEGEGFIVYTPGTHGMQRVIGINMCDLDVLRRFWQIVGAGNEPTVAREADERHKTCYRWKCSRWHEIERILARFMPHLGERRAARARELLADPAGPNRSGKTHCERGHPLTGENLKVERQQTGQTAGRIRRRCRACAREYDRARRVA